MKKFLAFSGGVESSAMCVLFADQAQPIFTDTGFEQDEMYERLNMFEGRISQIHGKEIKIIRIRAENVENTGANTLQEYIKARKFYPSFRSRFCTRLFKIEPMDRFLATQGECEVYIGLNADEEDERVGNYGACKNVKYSYPLVERDYTRQMCVDLLNTVGLLPDFPEFMERGGCTGCFFKRKIEYYHMAIQSPEQAYQVADLEEAIQDKRGEYYHIHSAIPNMRQFIDDCRSGRYVPKKQKESAEDTMQTSCGVFCHR